MQGRKNISEEFKLGILIDFGIVCLWLIDKKEIRQRGTNERDFKNETI